MWSCGPCFGYVVTPITSWSFSLCWIYVFDKTKWGSTIMNCSRHSGIRQTGKLKNEKSVSQK